MKLEKLTHNQIKITVSFKELLDNGIAKEDIGESAEWEHFFVSILKKAGEKFDFSLDSLLIDLIQQNTQEMILLLTITEEEFFIDISNPDISESRPILFVFKELEDVIQLSHRLSSVHQTGELFSYNGDYYLFISGVDDEVYRKLTTIISDYGNPVKFDILFLREYGEPIFYENAIRQLQLYFS